MTISKPRPRGRRRGLRATLIGGGVLVGLVGVLVGGYVHHNRTALEKGWQAVLAAGFVDKQETVAGRTLHYVEGPDNGPPLVLIHGQGSRLQDHLRVLPDLAREHHVFAVDVPGHGSSSRLAPAEYTNAIVGDLLAAFVDQVVGRPAILSGHSSGGLLALRVAAEHPDLVSGLLLEDPPLFSSEPERLPQTLGGVLPARAKSFLAEGGGGKDFQRYFLEHGDYFALFGPLAPKITRDAIAFADAHPGEPLRLSYLPPFVTVFFQGLVEYDPAFGAAWVQEHGGWYSGFDTTAALAAVDVPTTLVHTNYFEDRDGTAYSDGILMAAMDSDDVVRALDHLPTDTRLVQVQSGHLVHFEQPERYLEVAGELSARVG